MRNRLQKRSIQLIITISFTTIAVIAMSFMGIVLYAQFAENTKNTAIESNKQLLDQAGWNLNTYIRSMMSVSDTMYYSVIKNRDLTYEPLDREMALLYEANKDNLISIACINENGAVIAAAPVATRKQGIDILEQDWFIQANEKIENLHFSTPHVQNLFDNSNYRYYWVVSLSRSVELTNVGRTRKGVLLVDMNFSGIEQLLSKANEKGSGYIYLMDRNGEIIYHPQQQAIYSGLVQENNQEAATYEDGDHTEKFADKERVVIVKTVGYTGWKLVSVTPVTEFNVNLHQIRFFTIMIAAISILLILFGNVIVSSRVTDPIRKLEHSIKYLEEGNLDTDIYIGGTHEIRHLGRTITSMVRQMRKLMDDMVAEQQEKRKSALDALQSQINPHFLYNTLDSVVWMVESERYQEAISMVTALANLFRISLSKGKNIISIRDEIAHAKYYLDIQKVRYKNRFEIKIDVDPAIEDCCTIKLIVQPLLENAIYYGVEHMDGEGEITLRGYEDGNDVCIEVIDNGMGIPKENIALLLTDDTRVHKKGSGIGLRNIDQRIKLYFKGDYGLTIESELDEGTTVRIRLPKMYYSEVYKEVQDEEK
ncbi:MAG TPA: sensor histidine kinase [Lachnospiraceae bacterium]|nr:sensor histidine kinase [Lachnospiraceae bacterium]